MKDVKSLFLNWIKFNLKKYNYRKKVKSYPFEFFIPKEYLEELSEEVIEEMKKKYKL